jgi:hypothetical protein
MWYARKVGALCNKNYKLSLQTTTIQNVMPPYFEAKI